jgi:hypothetical protein
MNKAQFAVFDTFRTELKDYCNYLSSHFGAELSELQKEACSKDTPPYPIETPVVYNTALDSFSIDSDIFKIIIGDNPGKNEQLAVNRKYLIGLSGKIADGFFASSPELKTDFRKNVIILNKTPVHSAKTKHLKEIIKNASPELKKAVLESSLWMARKTAELHQSLCKNASSLEYAPELWLTGYAELKNHGIFLNYRDALKAAYKTEGTDSSDQDSLFWDRVFVYRHFSMNCFTTDLKKYMEKTGQTDKKTALSELGLLHKNEIFI